VTGKTVAGFFKDVLNYPVFVRFISEASSELCSRLLPRLVGVGWDCHALVRKGKEAPFGATPMEGDMLNAESLDSSTASLRVVVVCLMIFG
jgi:hypothetical protein